MLGKIFGESRSRKPLSQGLLWDKDIQAIDQDVSAMILEGIGGEDPVRVPRARLKHLFAVASAHGRRYERELIADQGDPKPRLMGQGFFRLGIILSVGWPVGIAVLWLMGKHAPIGVAVAPAVLFAFIYGIRWVIAGFKNSRR